ncbi:MAG: Hpt domain-containing protein, partial [Lachnospiraceae bacterium]|nr:Hpt domain-containing protein [Lachnospiraceae bacterium]
MDTSQYLDIFLDESKEHLQNLSDQIMELEQNPENMDTINEIFRAAHSLKGMAGTMGYKRMQTLTHDMENVFSEVRNGTFKVQPGMIDILFKSLDALEEYVNNIQQTTEEGSNDNQDLIDALNSILKNNGEVKVGESAAAETATVQEAPSAADGNAKGERWQNIKITDTEKMLIEKAGSEGLKAYGVTVYVEEACVLKAARAFLVFKALEKLGEIIVSSPTAQDIEDEKFELTFSLIFISANTADEIKEAVKGVSEIEEAFCAEYVVAAKPAEPEKPAESKPAEEAKPVNETAPVAAPAAAASSPAKPAATSAASSSAKPAAKPVVNRTVRVDIEKLDNLMNLVSELIIAKNSLIAATAAVEETKGDNGSVNEQIEYLESVTTNLHESVMKVRMVPIESVVAKFPRMIRDLSKKLDKKMELYMSGEDTELDRTVVDEIGDPLMHMLRNSADHGLEPNDFLVANGKPEVGSIFFD